MHQRVSASGRPSGTDGSDFSYRMVVDSRYQKVAHTKSILRSLFLVQAILYLIGLFLLIFLSKSEDFTSYRLGIGTTACGLISLIIGELGRKRSRVKVLGFFMSTASLAMSFFLLVGIQQFLRLRAAPTQSYWESMMKAPEIPLSLLGMGFHVPIMIYTSVLIRNMSPPKRAS